MEDEMKVMRAIERAERVSASQVEAARHRCSVKVCALLESLPEEDGTRERVRAWAAAKWKW